MLQMYDHLVQMGNAVPIPGNKSGSYLTAFSLQGFYTDINGIISGFVQIFVDQSYWQSAVAASPMQAVKVSLLPNASCAVIGIIMSIFSPGSVRNCFCMLTGQSCRQPLNVVFQQVPCWHDNLHMSCPYNREYMVPARGLLHVTACRCAPPTLSPTTAHSPGNFMCNM